MPAVHEKYVLLCGHTKMLWKRQETILADFHHPILVNLGTGGYFPDAETIENVTTNNNDKVKSPNWVMLAISAATTREISGSE